MWRGEGRAQHWVQDLQAWGALEDSARLPLGLGKLFRRPEEPLLRGALRELAGARLGQADGDTGSMGVPPLARQSPLFESQGPAPTLSLSTPRGASPL